MIAHFLSPQEFASVVQMATEVRTKPLSDVRRAATLAKLLNGDQLLKEIATSTAFAGFRVRAMLMVLRLMLLLLTGETGM